MAITPKMEYLWETDQRKTLKQILEQDKQFIPYNQTDPNFGFSQSGLWLRAHIDNLSETEEWVVNIEYSQLDYVDFYLIKDGQTIASSMQGKMQADQKLRMPSFDLPLPIGEPMTLYIRAQSQSSSLIIPIRLQSERSHILYSQIDGLAWGVFYGGLIILAIYNFVLYLNVREPSIIAYISYLIAVLVWQFVWGGYIQWIFPNGQPLWFAEHTELIFSAVGLSSSLFTLYFLEAKYNAPKTLPVLKTLIGLQLVLAIIALLGVLPPTMKNTIIYGVGTIALLICITSGFEAFINRFRPAVYFISAWTMLVTGAVVGMLGLIGVLPSNPFTAYCFQVGVFFEASLFSIALMQKSRHQLQSEVEQASNDLINNMELIEEQNARLDIARKDAIKASNIKSQFLANMSHEIRTPLNAIMGFSRELGQAGLSIAQSEQVRIINSAADNLLTIVNDVLDFSKIEAGKLQINNAAFSPLEVFEEMVAIMAKTAHSKNLDFIFYASPLPEKLISDDIRLKQVLTNLIGNALKFTSEGNVCLSVWAQRRQHGVIDLCFRVADTGIGISRNDRKKLFSAFSQVDDALNRSYQGTGLGLVISQELVRLMNGSIELKSQPGVGSTFTVKVRAQQLSPRSTFSFPQTVNNLTVAVFDPSPMSRRATSSMLKDLGASVYAIDSLDYLQSLDIKPDFLMVFLPNNTRYSDITVMHCAISVPAKQRIVWYSTEDPLVKVSLFQESFTKSIGMPATPSRLIQILSSERVSYNKPVVKPTIKLPSIRMLAVDDMSMNLMLIDTWFRDTPIILTQSHSGEDAVKLCQENIYDIILMDVQMPGIDGLQASKEIRKTDLNMGTPIIAVTAHAFREEQDRLLSSGMDDYLPKPIAYDDLLSVIERWCESGEKEALSAPNASWQLAMQRANDNEAISRQMMYEFMQLLPDARAALEDAENRLDLDALQQEIHRLHGASCYTGAPVIQSLASHIEGALKKTRKDEAMAKMPALYEAITQFMYESEKVLEQHGGEQSLDFDA